jgi:hypothetical protein
VQRTKKKMTSGSTFFCFVRAGVRSALVEIHNKQNEVTAYKVPSEKTRKKEKEEEPGHKNTSPAQKVTEELLPLPF